LRVAELGEQAPDVAVDRLGPDALPGAEVAADQRRVDPLVRGRGVEGDQAPLTVAGHTELRPRPRLPLDPVDRRQHLLHLVADDVSAHVVRLSVDPFAVRLVGQRDPRVPEHSIPRLMRVGTTTRKPFATSRRANWDSARTPGRRPAICSGVWSASGRAMTWPSTAPLGSSSRPSPWTPSRTGQRTW